ncbi:MAG: hypothetical protein IJZ64_04355 [Ruminococcus sp.]|nr:hypothetical protein [Ruminococcus sp.]
MDNNDIEKQINIDRWFYSRPYLEYNNNGDLILIKKLSFGPLEIWEYGLNKNGKYYEMYEWLENDYFKDLNHKTEISKEYICKEINSLLDILQKNDLNNWVELYNDIYDRIQQDKL